MGDDCSCPNQLGTPVPGGGGGGGGGTQTLSQAGNIVSLSPGGGSVDISVTTSVASSAQKTTAQSYSEGLLATTFDGLLFAGETEIGKPIEPALLTVNGSMDVVVAPMGAVTLQNLGSVLTPTGLNTVYIDPATGALGQGANSGGWVGTATSDLNMNGYNITNSVNVPMSISSTGLLSIGSGSASSDTFYTSGKDLYINTLADKIIMGAGSDVDITSANGDITIDTTAFGGLSGSVNVTASTAVTVTAPTVSVNGTLDMNGNNIVDGADIDLKGASPSLNFQNTIGVQKATLDYAELTDKVTLLGTNAVVESTGTGKGRLILDATASVVELRADDVTLRMRQYDPTGVLSQAEVAITPGGVMGISADGAMTITAPVGVTVNGSIDMTDNPISNALTVNGATLAYDANANIKLGDTFTGDSPAGNNAIAIGSGAGNTGGGAGQQETAIAIGQDSGIESQGIGAVALGANSGGSIQGAYGVCVGANAGQSGQGTKSVAVGYFSAQNSQGASSVAVGAEAGKTSQGASAIAIGERAGLLNQGANSIAIGKNAITAGTGVSAGTIVINATGVALNPAQADSLYVKPVRAVQASNAYQISPMLYNATTSEVFYGTAFYTVVRVTAPTSIALNAGIRGRTYIATSTGAQTLTFTNTLTANDTGFSVKVKNGNAVGTGDITIAGATGNLIVHNPTLTASGGIVYLYWTGTALQAF